ncbi:MAG: hypothetical protein A2158_08095 [Chloroflexi bacterium RBG_13_46_14]|nr:MAG: hypothetical protein A2158_08095 [Chloroflexi bacterium RBG_13_46_14]
MSNIIRKVVRFVIIKILSNPPSKSPRRYIIENKQWHHNSIIDSLTPQFIKIGRNFISGPNSVILSHDASYLLFTRKYAIQPTIIGDDVFLGAGAIVLPGVKIGNRVCIGAGSVVTHDIHDNCVVAGNPAKIISSIDEYIKKAQTKGVLYSPPYSFDQIRTQKGHVTDEQVNEFQKSAVAEYRRRNPGVNDWINYIERRPEKNKDNRI